jgi:peptidoglycan/xylan/chitin deacetylase (PgdA/CDA1 family)
MKPLARTATLFASGAAIGALALLIYERGSTVKTYALANDVLVHGNTQLKEVALTIDDGPKPENARALLDLLGKYDVRATFFVVGKQVQKYPALVRRMMDEGHEVGNHTEDHITLKGLKEKQIREEIVACDKAVFRATGAHTNVFRPPGMRFDQTVLSTAQEIGFVTVHWNVAVGDYVDLKPEEIARKVLAKTQPGSVILLHGHPDTVKALPTILESLKARGYRFVTVSQMLARLPRPVYVKTNAYGVDDALWAKMNPTPTPAPVRPVVAKRHRRVARAAAGERSLEVPPRTALRGVDLPAGR